MSVSVDSQTIRVEHSTMPVTSLGSVSVTERGVEHGCCSRPSDSSRTGVAQAGQRAKASEKLLARLSGVSAVSRPVHLACRQ